MSRNFQLLQRAELDRKQADLEEVGASTSGGSLPGTEPSDIPCDARLRISPSEIDPEIVELVQRLFLLPNDRPPQCVVFFALGSGEGASVCVRAAEALSANFSGAVCVVDANFDSPTMHDLYSIENKVGFSEALMQADPLESYAHQVKDSNLTVIPAGSNLLAWKSEPARRCLADLRSRFDYVLIEVPANSGFSSAVMLGQLADGAVVVVEADVTRREVARNLVDELIGANIRVLGTVLNNRRFPIPERLYRAL